MWPFRVYGTLYCRHDDCLTCKNFVSSNSARMFPPLLGCFNLFCNVWVSVCVAVLLMFVGVLVISALVFTVFCIVCTVHLCLLCFVLFVLCTFVLLFCVLCTVFLYCFVYVYLFIFVTSVRTTATE